METMIQPKVTGYRQLTKAEVDLMNEGKALAEQVGAWISKLQNHPPLSGVDPDRWQSRWTGMPLVDQRWVAIGATGLQQGFMAAIRGIAKPETF